METVKNIWALDLLYVVKQVLQSSNTPPKIPADIQMAYFTEEMNGVNHEFSLIRFLSLFSDRPFYSSSSVPKGRTFFFSSNWCSGAASVNGSDWCQVRATRSWELCSLQEMFKVWPWIYLAFPFSCRCMKTTALNFWQWFADILVDTAFHNSLTGFGLLHVLSAFLAGLLIEECQCPAKGRMGSGN